MSLPRRFELVRDRDESGVSGVGHVADGCAFPCGKAVMVWRTGVSSCAFYDSMDDLVAIHGHNGMTRVAWIDPEEVEQPVEEDPPCLPE